MSEGLGLGLGGGGCGEGGLGFGGGGGGGEELDLLADAAAEIGNVFPDVGVVVALVGVLCSKRLVSFCEGRRKSRLHT